MQIAVPIEVQTGQTSKSPLTVPTVTDDFMRLVQGHFVAKETETAQQFDQKTLELDQESSQTEDRPDGAACLDVVDIVEPNKHFLSGETSLSKKPFADQLAVSDNSLEKNVRNAAPLPAAFLANGWDVRERNLVRSPQFADQKTEMPTPTYSNLFPGGAGKRQVESDAKIALIPNTKSDIKLNIDGAPKVQSELSDLKNPPKPDAQPITTSITPAGMPIPPQAFEAKQAVPLGLMADSLATRGKKEPVSSTPKADPQNAHFAQNNSPAPKPKSVVFSALKNSAEDTNLKSSFMPADIAIETLDQVADEDFAATLVGADRHAIPLSSSLEMRSAPSVQVATVVAQQLAVAVQKNPNGVTELVLNPEELGRVKLAMSTLDGAITMTITTERPETQDLMRRHIDVLAQELRQMGFSDVGFSFREQGRQESNNSSNENSLAFNDLEVEAAMPEPTPAETTGLDLRL